VVAAAQAQAAQFKMVACASTSGAPPYTTSTNTANAQHPNGIFDFINGCGGAGGDPPGDSAFMRIAEHEASGNAGEGAYGQIIFNTPAYVHFKAAGGYTREPNAFNDGWRSIFWGIDFNNNGVMFLNQGSGVGASGVNTPTSGTFGPHLWPFGNFLDFHHFLFELRCVRPAGCDRANYNATDANGFVFILNDDEAPDVYFLAQESGLMQGKWVTGPQWVPWYIHDNGSGLRNERIRVDGVERYNFDHQAHGECNATFSQVNGEFSRNYQPCPFGPFWHDWTLNTQDFSDGAHTLQICAQDYGMYQGLNGTGGEKCDSRTIHVDSHAPGAPAGLHVTSANPNLYLEHFGAQWTLPPDSGSPIAKVHYQLLNEAGEALGAEKTISGTNPTSVPEITGPAKAGAYELKVWLEDSVGLVGPAATAPIPHDSTPPAAPQGVSVTPPGTSRAEQGFDLRWRNIVDSGSPIDLAHYEIVNGAGGAVVPNQAVGGDNIQAVENLETPRERGGYSLRLWLEDAEGNVGAPVTVPLAYSCMRSDVAGGSSLSSGLGDSRVGQETVMQGSGTILRGKLLGGNGAGIGDAPICVFSRVVTDDGRDFLGVAISGSDGGYQFAIPAGASRELSAVYRSGSREVSALANLKTVVHPEFKVRRKIVYNKHKAWFLASIPGPHNNHVQLVIQVFKGKKWEAFHRYSTRDDGKMVVPYKFNKTRNATKYKMRVQLRYQPAYPFEEGDSDPLNLIVLPHPPHHR
jgi:hypothetical protein